MRARARAILICLTLTQASMVPYAALAQPKDAATDTARKRFQEGVKYFDQHKYEDARAAFLQAYALRRHPAVLLNLAQSELRSNHPLEAAQHFSAFLRDSTTASAAERNDADKGLAAAREKIGRLQVQINADGAEILVDGERVGVSPLVDPVDVAASTHTIEGRSGGKSVTSSVTAAAGKVTPVSLTLERPVAAEPAAAAPSAPTPTPAATPPPPPAPSEPPPTVEVSTEGRQPFFTWLTHHPLGLTTLGVTVVGTGIGFTFYAMAQGVQDKANSNAEEIRNDYAQRIIDYNDPSTRSSVPADIQQRIVTGSPALCVSAPARYQVACSTLQTNLDAEHSDRTVATVGFVAAGVGVASMVTAYFLTSAKPSGATASVGDHRPASPTAVLVPILGSHQAGLGLVGSF